MLATFGGKTCIAIVSACFTTSWDIRATAAKLPGTLIYKIVADATTASNLLLTNQLTATAVNIAGPDIGRLSNDKGLTRKRSLNTNSAVLAFNMAAGHVTTDASVRKALSIAIDRAQFLHAGFPYGAQLSNSLDAPGSPCYTKSLNKFIPKASQDAGVVAARSRRNPFV